METTQCRQCHSTIPATSALDLHAACPVCGAALEADAADAGGGFAPPAPPAKGAPSHAKGLKGWWRRNASHVLMEFAAALVIGILIFFFHGAIEHLWAGAAEPVWNQFYPIEPDAGVFVVEADEQQFQEFTLERPTKVRSSVSVSHGSGTVDAFFVRGSHVRNETLLPGAERVAVQHGARASSAEAMLEEGRWNLALDCLDAGDACLVSVVLAYLGEAGEGAPHVPQLHMLSQNSRLALQPHGNFTFAFSVPASEPERTVQWCAVDSYSLEPVPEVDATVVKASDLAALLRGEEVPAASSDTGGCGNFLLPAGDYAFVLRCLDAKHGCGAYYTLAFHY